MMIEPLVTEQDQLTLASYYQHLSGCPYCQQAEQDIRAILADIENLPPEELARQAEIRKRYAESISTKQE